MCIDNKLSTSDKENPSLISANCLILVVIWFVLDIYYRIKSEQKNEIIKNAPNMTKYEFVKKHSFVLAMVTLLIIFIIMSFLT